MSSPVNKFLRREDFRSVAYASIRQELEDIYLNLLHKTPSLYGAEHECQTLIHWSRDWEYPWAIVNSRVAAGHRVLDCGCGGSPLLPLLARHGCEAYGIDIGLNQARQSLANHYAQLFRRLRSKVIRGLHREKSPDAGRGAAGPGRRPARSLLKRALAALQRPNDAWVCDARRLRKLRLNIRYFEESLADMYFENEYFDRVFCISVIEHLTEETAHAGIKEMVRVLRRGGLLVVTMDNDGPHVTPQLAGKFQDIIAESGLQLLGESDFSMPRPEDVPGTYNVVGFILTK